MGSRLPEMIGIAGMITPKIPNIKRTRKALWEKVIYYDGSADLETSCPQLNNSSSLV